MDLARIASWEYDERSRLFQFDDIFYQLLGTDAATEGGYFMSPEKYVGEFVHPDDALSVIDYMLNGSKGVPPDGFGQIEHRFVTRSGEVRNFLVRIGWIKDENGDPLTTYGVNYDVTDVKRSGNAVTDRIEGLEYPER